MFIPKLPDPRNYAHLTPKNNLVIAFQKWADSHPDDKKTAEEHVRFLLEQALAAGEDKLLAVALSLMPSAQAYRTLWSWMADATWMHPKTQTLPFVVPLVIVAASPQPVTVPGELADVSALRDLWLGHEVFPGEAEVWLSNRLLSPGALVDLLPSNLYEWSLLKQPVYQGWPLLPNSTPLNDVRQEGAYLRFIPGIVSGVRDASWPKGVGRWGREASQLLSSQLGATGATALALPRAPQPVLKALEDGRQAQHGIALQLFLANALRQFRERGKEPVAVMAVYDDHALRLCLDDGESQSVYSRTLTALDDLPAMEQEIAMLLQECRVESIHTVTDVQPHQVGGKSYVCGIEALAL